MIFYVILNEYVEIFLVQFFFFSPPRIRIRSHMDIFWIPDPE